MTSLTRRTIAETGVAVTEVGFGGASLGNLYQETSDGDALGAVERAWERGVRYFDTAPHYGLGLSERRLGKALAGLPRDEYRVSTKVGRLLVPNPTPTARDTDGFAVPGDLTRVWDFSRDGILASLEASLERLGTDHVDIVYAHDPDQHSQGSARHSLEVLRQLQREGVVRTVGLGTNSVNGLDALIEDGLLDVVMLAGRFTLLDQSGLESVLEPARRAGVAVEAVGVFNSGLLATSRPRPDAKFDYGDAPSHIIDRAHRIASICKGHGVSLPAAAIAFPLRHEAVVGVTLGIGSARQVDENVDRYLTEIPAALWDDLASAGLTAVAA